MNIRIISILLNDIQGNDFIIFGAGKYGSNVAEALQLNGKNILKIFDNDPAKWNRRIRGIQVCGPDNQIFKCNYLVAVADVFASHRLKEQLKELGVDEDNIYLYNNETNWNYWKNLQRSDYKTEISRLYYETFGRQINWNHPVF